MIRKIRWREWFPLMVLASSFGIYLHPYPVRLEHFVVYLTLGIVFFRLIRSGRLLLPNELRPLTTVLGVFLIYSLLISGFNGVSLSNHETLGQVDRFVLPLAVIATAGWAFGQRGPAYLYGLINRLAIVLVIGSVIVSLVILYQALIGPPAWLRHFLPGGDADFVGRGTVAERSFRMGRSTGIFATPFEAGIFLSTALIFSVYLIGRGQAKFIGYIGFVVICIGGLLTVSKAFLVGMALAFFFILWSVDRKSSFRLGALLIPSILVFLFVFRLLSHQWIGFDYLARLWRWREQEDLINLFTAGRFTGDGGGVLLNRWGDARTILGGGFDSYGVLDNAFLEVWLVGGVFGVLFLSFLLLYPLYFGWLNRGALEGKVLFIVSLFFVIASLGAPALTKNRISVVVFILISVLLLLCCRSPKLQKTKRWFCAGGGCCAILPQEQVIPLQNVRGNK